MAGAAEGRVAQTQGCGDRFCERSPGFWKLAKNGHDARPRLLLLCDKPLQGAGLMMGAIASQNTKECCILWG